MLEDVAVEEGTKLSGNPKSSIGALTDTDEAGRELVIGENAGQLTHAGEEVELLVRVRRQWNDWKIAVYRLQDIEDLHWADISGGIRARAPYSFIHGYVWCNEKIEGELAHSCMHGPVPHRIKICITKKYNEAVFPRIKLLAKPSRYS